MNPIKKCQKKAWKIIRKLPQVTNMLEAESLINYAINITFGLNDLGVIKYAMSSLNFDKSRIAYGVHKYERFDQVKTIRTDNFNTYKSQVKEYLISLIPARLHRCEMFKSYSS